MYAHYLDLWQQVGHYLTVASDTVSIASGGVVNAAKVVLNRVFISALEALTKATSDPRDEVALDIAKSMETLRKGLLNIDALLAATGDPKILQLKVAMGMAKLTVTALEKVSEELVKDPPRADFDQVRMPIVTQQISLLAPDSPENALFNAGANITNCSNQAVDGLQVALLAAERAWGAKIANDSAAIQSQSAAYSAGVDAANAAIEKCKLVFDALPALLAQAGIADYNGSGIPPNNSIDAESLAIIRQAILEIGQYSAEEIDAALAIAISDTNDSDFGNLYVGAENLRNAFLAAPQLDPNLNVAEPSSLLLVMIAGLAFVVVRRRSNLKLVWS